MQYDYGDGWEVMLRLEEIIEDRELPGKELPRVLEGEGYGIIEDCGGPQGLAHLGEVFKNHPCGCRYLRHVYTLRWVHIAIA